MPCAVSALFYEPEVAIRIRCEKLLFDVVKYSFLLNMQPIKTFIGVFREAERRKRLFLMILLHETAVLSQRHQLVSERMEQITFAQ